MEIKKNGEWKKIRFDIEKNLGFVSVEKQFICIHPIEKSKINFMVSLKLVEWNQEENYLDVLLNTEFEYKVGTKEKNALIKGDKFINTLIEKYSFKLIPPTFNKSKALEEAFKKLKNKDTKKDVKDTDLIQSEDF